jgi:RHS repeat-associated protein
VQLAYEGGSQIGMTGIGSTATYPNSLGMGSETTGANTSYYRREPGGKLVSEKISTGRYYYLYDNVGSVIGLTDQSGTQVNTYKYEPYGKVASSTGSTFNRFKFAGGMTLGTGTGTDLYHFGARYYDPESGRWTQQDPINHAGDISDGNAYAYGADDPVDNTDSGGCQSNNEVCNVCHAYRQPPRPPPGMPRWKIILWRNCWVLCMVKHHSICGHWHGPGGYFACMAVSAGYCSVRCAKNPHAYDD